MLICPITGDVNFGHLLWVTKFSWFWSLSWVTMKT